MKLFEGGTQATFNGPEYYFDLNSMQYAATSYCADKFCISTRFSDFFQHNCGCSFFIVTSKMDIRILFEKVIIFMNPFCFSTSSIKSSGSIIK